MWRLKKGFSPPVEEQNWNIPFHVPRQTQHYALIFRCICLLNTMQRMWQWLYSEWRSRLDFHIKLIYRFILGMNHVKFMKKSLHINGLLWMNIIPFLNRFQIMCVLFLKCNFVRERVKSPAVGIWAPFNYHIAPYLLTNRMGQHCLVTMKRRRDGSDDCW